MASERDGTWLSVERLIDLQYADKIAALERTKSNNEKTTEDLTTRESTVTQQLDELRTELEEVKENLHKVREQFTDTSAQLEQLRASKREKMAVAKDLETKLNEITLATKVQGMTFNEACYTKGLMTEDDDALLQTKGEATFTDRDALMTDHLADTTEELRGHSEALRKAQTELIECESHIQELARAQEFGEMQKYVDQAQAIKDRVAGIKRDVELCEGVLRGDIQNLAKLLEQKTNILEKIEARYVTLQANGIQLFKEERYEEVIEITQELMEKKQRSEALRNEIEGLRKIGQQPEPSVL